MLQVYVWKGRPVVCNRLLQVQAEVHRLEDNANAAVTNSVGKFGDVRDMWMQNLLNVGSSERGEEDASATSDLGDSLEYLENDVT